MSDQYVMIKCDRCGDMVPAGEGYMTHQYYKHSPSTEDSNNPSAGLRASPPRISEQAIKAREDMASIVRSTSPVQRGTTPNAPAPSFPAQAKLPTTPAAQSTRATSSGHYIPSGQNPSFGNTQGNQPTASQPGSTSSRIPPGLSSSSSLPRQQGSNLIFLRPYTSESYNRNK